MTPAGLPLCEPFDWRPGRLWSLLDMLEIHGAPFLTAVAALAEIALMCRIPEPHPDSVLGVDDHTLRHAKHLSDVLANLKLPLASKAAQTLFELLSEKNPKLRAVDSQIRDVQSRMRDELEHRRLFVMDSQRAKFYAGAADLFEQELADKFSAAIDDIEGAGKCLALGQGTACVLHLMRVMEVGLRSLAKLLGIPYAPSWEAYLRQIQDRIAAKHRTKGVRWKRDEPFFRDASGDLLTVKQAWRNPTMHVVRKYSAEEAEEIFRAVRAFMKRLSEKV